MTELPPVFSEYRQLMSEEDFQVFKIDLIETFKDVTPVHIAELKAAFVEKDQGAYRRAAHSLKSSGRTFQLTRLTSLAAQLEELDCLEDEKAITNIIPAFELEVQKAINSLDALLEE